MCYFRYQATLANYFMQSTVHDNHQIISEKKNETTKWVSNCSFYLYGKNNLLSFHIKYKAKFKFFNTNTLFSQHILILWHIFSSETRWKLNRLGCLGVVIFMFSFLIFRGQH